MKAEKMSIEPNEIGGELSCVKGKKPHSPSNVEFAALCKYS